MSNAMQSDPPRERRSYPSAPRAVVDGVGRREETGTNMRTFRGWKRTWLERVTGTPPWELKALLNVGSIFLGLWYLLPTQARRAFDPALEAIAPEIWWGIAFFAFGVLGMFGIGANDVNRKHVHRFWVGYGMVRFSVWGVFVGTLWISEGYGPAIPFGATLLIGAGWAHVRGWR